jgi:hypothetical protein
MSSENYFINFTGIKEGCKKGIKEEEKKECEK